MKAATFCSSLGLGGEVPAAQQLKFQGRVPAFRSGVIEARPDPTRPMDWVTPSRPQAALKRSAVYSDPLSEWKITPSTFPPRTAAAIKTADIANRSEERRVG